MRKLESEIASLQKNLRKSQENYKTKKISFSKVNDSFAGKVEEHLIFSDPQMYVQHGCKNWSLIHKHAAILENKCKGKLPKRSDIPELLKTANDSSDREYSFSSCLLDPRHRKTTAINPAMTELERHGVVFPNKSSSPPICSMHIASPAPV